VAQLSRRQQRHLDHLLLASAHRKTVEAYQMRDFWELSAVQAEHFLESWCDCVRDSELVPMRRFADTVEKHRDGILRWYWTLISNGLLEGLSPLVQATKALARGYRSTRNLTAVIYLMHGKLSIQKPI
jgi:transposase